MEIKNGQLVVYDVDTKYRDYLRKFDSKVSEKENRRFYGILVTVNEVDYCIPFTCKVKKRNSKLTINIKNKKKVIAQLLINNMIPVTEKVIEKVDVDNDKDREYLIDEIKYLKRKSVITEIIYKTENALKILNNPEHGDYSFFRMLCCDFKLLEKKSKNYLQ